MIGLFPRIWCFFFGCKFEYWTYNVEESRRAGTPIETRRTSSVCQRCGTDVSW